MLYGISQNSCPKILPRLYGKPSRNNSLKTVLYDPRNSCQNCMDCTKFHPEIYYSNYLDFCANKSLYDSLGMHANLLRNSSIVSLDFYARKMAVWPLEIRTVWFALIAVPCLEIRASLLPWDVRSALQMLPLSSPARPLSCSLLFSQQECLNNPQWVHPLALIDLMREGEGFSNLTVEIRLDECLRFDVSSLTLTLVIKSSFNLHLTN
jgi:hypothetical protein